MPIPQQGTLQQVLSCLRIKKSMDGAKTLLEREALVMFFFA